MSSPISKKPLVERNTRMSYTREEAARRAEEANGRPNTPGMC